MQFHAAGQRPSATELAALEIENGATKQEAWSTAARHASALGAACSPPRASPRQGPVGDAARLEGTLRARWSSTWSASREELCSLLFQQTYPRKSTFST